MILFNGSGVKKKNMNTMKKSGTLFGTRKEFYGLQRHVVYLGMMGFLGHIMEMKTEK